MSEYKTFESYQKLVKIWLGTKRYIKWTIYTRITMYVHMKKYVYKVRFTLLPQYISPSVIM